MGESSAYVVIYFLIFNYFSIQLITFYIYKNTLSHIYYSIKHGYIYLFILIREYVVFCENR